MINLLDLQAAVASSTYFTEVSRKLNLFGTTNVKRHITRHNIDISHFKRSPRKKKPLLDKHCQYCSLPFTTCLKKKRFCNRMCASFFMHARRKNDKCPRPRALKLCKHCNTPLKEQHPASRVKYCSRSCFATVAKTRTYQRFLNQEENMSPGTRRVCVIQRDGNYCRVCGCEAIHNGAPLSLQLDHIDGDSDNNSPTNLRLLCPNCHTQTPTYGSKNCSNSVRAKYSRLNRRRVIAIVSSTDYINTTDYSI